MTRFRSMKISRLNLKTNILAMKMISLSNTTSHLKQAIKQIPLGPAMHKEIYQKKIFMNPSRIQKPSQPKLIKTLSHKIQHQSQ